MDPHSLECLDFLRVRELLARHAITALGRSLAGMVQPAGRLELAQRWLNQVSEMQALIERRGAPPFGGITDVREIVKKCAPPLQVSVEDVSRIGNTLAASHALAAYLAELPEEHPELRHLADRIGDFGSVAERIRSVIDERDQVRDDASPKLASLRRAIESAARRIREVVDRLLRDPAVRRLLQFPNHTFHNDRFVLPLRTECRGRLRGIVHRGSDSGATIYVEPDQAVELNNIISNLRIEEVEEIARLLRELTHEIHINADEILKTLDTVAVLDLIVAKVRFAEAFQMRCPELSDEGRLNLRGARHPLLIELALRKSGDGQPVDEVVPINVRLGDDFNLLSITGPNTGGKTVALKTVGLLTLMAQTGIPIPVEPGSSAGIFRNVLIDVGDEQNMQQSLSTFSAHLTRQMDMLRKAGPRTLVLIDELGAGTDPDEGAAIGRAVLDELLRLDCRCMVSTHIGALKAFALSRRRVENASVEFDLQSLKPTYRLRIGEAGSSNAIEIAERLGAPRRLIAAARRNLSRKARALKVALDGTSAAKRQAEQARDSADQARVDADHAQNAAEAARHRLEKQKADFREWVRRIVHLQPGDAVRIRNFDRDGRIVRMRLDQQRAEVDVGAFAVEVPLGDVLPPQTPPPPPRPDPPPRPAPARRAPEAPRKPARRAQQPRAEKSAHRSRPEPRPQRQLPSITDEQAAALKPGDMIIAKRFHREGTVVRIKSAKKIAIVSVGLLEVEVPFNGLALPARPDPPKPAARAKPKPVAEKPAPAAAVSTPSDAPAAPEQTDTASAE